MHRSATLSAGPASGGLKGRKARPPARGLRGEPRRASVTHLAACAVGPHGTRASTGGLLPSSRLGPCGTTIARFSSLPPFKRPANGGSGRREAPCSRLRRGRRVGLAVPRPRPRVVPRTRSPAYMRARAVLRRGPLFLTTTVWRCVTDPKAEMWEREALWRAMKGDISPSCS